MTRSFTPLAERSDVFESLAAPHLPMLSALAWQLTRDPGQAEDLVQETLLKAYRFLHRFELGTNFRGWLVTMMRHLYFSQLRKQAREVLTGQVEYVADDDEQALRQEPEVAHLQTLATALPHLVSDEVFDALQELPETYRTAVLLADVLEYSYKEMADLLGCPLGTVMSRLFRGRQKLQARLQPYAIEQGYVHPETPVESPDTETTSDHHACLTTSA
jgi:RNA polymerase sigma-70 factor, ECF subfamily